MSQRVALRVIALVYLLYVGAIVRMLGRMSQRVRVIALATSS
jgi:hypothetical protein